MKEIGKPDNITADQYRAWRSPIRGTSNPHKMNNPVWEWLVESRLSAYQANELFDGPSSVTDGPAWCFDRFGQSITELPDGRLAIVGGEHEDHYDPDFYIYNDLVLTASSGTPEIYGYPIDVFPATDFHSATLTDGAILLIGNLGYPESRRAGYTQVLRLDLESLRMSRIESSGNNPGWIHDHTANITDDNRGIIISGGKVDLCDGTWLFENIDEWRLDTRNWRWERLSNRAWPRFEVYRQDHKMNHLWHLRQLLWSQEVGWEDVEEKTKELTEELGNTPRIDILPSLYKPSFTDEVLPQEEDEYNIYRIRVEGVVVRYVEDSFVIQVTVEGKLPEQTIRDLKSDLADKLSLLEQTIWHCRTIPGL